MATKKELVVSMSTSEEGIEANLRKAMDIDGGILITHEGNKFIVNKDDLKQAITEIEEFENELS